jgi:low density lipoprotein receptor-related protein 5/6
VYLVLVNVLLGPTSATAVILYWTDSTAGKIQRLDTSGSGVTDVVTGLTEPIGLAIDARAEHLFWTDRGTAGVHTANIDGTNPELLASGQHAVNDIEIDDATGRLYWSTSVSKSILMANLDGSGVTDIITTGAVDVDGIALDLVDGKIYWTDGGTGPLSPFRQIQRADLDGSNAEALIPDTQISDPSNLHDLMLDIAGGKMYWTINLGGAESIWRADLDGGNPELIVSGFPSPWGIALDATAGKFYWTDDTFGTINRANLDGTDVELVASGLSTPRSLVLVPEPSTALLVGMGLAGLAIRRRRQH